MMEKYMLEETQYVNTKSEAEKNDIILKSVPDCTCNFSLT